MNKSFSVNVAKIFSGRAVIQVLVILTAPVIARLYSPENFGVFQLFNSILLILSAISSLHYDRSIPLGKTQREASASFLLSMFSIFIITGCSFSGVLFGRKSIALWFHSPDLADFLWLLPVFVFTYGLRNVLNYWAAREGRFGATVWADVGNSLCDRILIVVLGYLPKATAIGLFSGHLAGSIVQVLVLLGAFGRKIIVALKHAQLSFAVLRAVSLQHKKFPLFSTWGQLLTVISAQLPALFLSRYFPPSIVGYYALMRRVCSMPMTVLGLAIGQVFFPTAAKEYHETGTLAPIVKNAFTRLVQIGMFPMAILGLFGDTLFGFVFGQQWTEAGVYAQILSGWYLMSSLTLPLNISALVNRQDIYFLLTVVKLLGRTAVLFIGVAFGLPRFTLGLFALFSVGFLVAHLIWMLRLAGVSGVWAVKTILTHFLLSCALLIPVKGLSGFLNDIRIDLVALSFATLGYGVVLIVTDPVIRQFLITTIHRFTRIEQLKAK